MTPGESELADHAGIRNLVVRYFAAVDDKRLDQATVEATFTGDGRLVRPNGGALVGIDAIAIGHSQSFARFKATHHVSSDYVIDLDGNTAKLRANLTAMHLWEDEERDPNTLETYFLAGGVLHAGAERTTEGWRIEVLALRNTWRTGAGFAAILATGT
jgi:hypothetical protein